MSNHLIFWWDDLKIPMCFWLNFVVRKVVNVGIIVWVLSSLSKLKRNFLKLKIDKNKRVGEKKKPLQFQLALNHLFNKLQCLVSYNLFRQPFAFPIPKLHKPRLRRIAVSRPAPLPRKPLPATAKSPKHSDAYKRAQPQIPNSKDKKMITNPHSKPLTPKAASLENPSVRWRYFLWINYSNGLVLFLMIT